MIFEIVLAVGVTAGFAWGVRAAAIRVLQITEPVPLNDDETQSLGVWTKGWMISQGPRKGDKVAATAEAIVREGKREVLLQLGAVSKERALEDWSELQQLMNWEQGGSLPEKKRENT
jgi:hypothetical protein